MASERTMNKSASQSMSISRPAVSLQNLLYCCKASAFTVQGCRWAVPEGLYKGQHTFFTKVGLCTISVGNQLASGMGILRIKRGHVRCDAELAPKYRMTSLSAILLGGSSASKSSLLRGEIVFINISGESNSGVVSADESSTAPSPSSSK